MSAVTARTDEAFVDGHRSVRSSRCLIRARRAIVSFGGVFVLANWAGRASNTTVAHWATVVQNPGVVGDAGLGVFTRLILCSTSKKNDAVVESTGHFVGRAWCHLGGQPGPFPGRGGVAVEQPGV